MNVSNQNQDEASIREWFYTMLFLIIPLVNILVAVDLAYGNNDPFRDSAPLKSKRNFAKAYLIILLVSVLLTYFTLFI
jgi:hypothetical protein